MLIGTYEDNYPKGHIKRGWDPQNPTQPRITVPVTKDETTNEYEFIWPGHLIFLTADNTWTKNPGDTATTKPPAVICVANDASIKDYDVVAANGLHGYPTTYPYTFETPFFRRKSSDNYTMGTPLTFCANTENIDGTTTTAGQGTAQGYLRPAATGEAVIGYISEVPTAPYVGINGSFNLRPSFKLATNSTAKRENSYTIVWTANYKVDAPTA